MKSIFWHRRDLRLTDNAGLYKALKNSSSVQPIFIFDKTILSKLKTDDQRILFIHQEVVNLKKQYQELGSDLKVYFGDPIDLLPKIVNEFNIQKVYTNRDYEPYAFERDNKINTLLSDINIEFIGTKDHVILRNMKLRKQTVYHTPYLLHTPANGKKS